MSETTTETTAPFQVTLKMEDNNNLHEALGITEERAKELQAIDSVLYQEDYPTLGHRFNEMSKHARTKEELVLITVAIFG